MVLVVVVFQCCVATLPSCGVGGNGVSVLCNHQVVVLVVVVFQCCVAGSIPAGVCVLHPNTTGCAHLLNPFTAFLILSLNYI